MKKEPKELYVGEMLNGKKFTWFQDICRYVAKEFVYKASGENVTMHPKYGNHDITYWTTRKDGTIEVVKAKCRVDVDESYDTLVVDDEYIDKLRDAVKDAQFGGTRKVKGTLMFPVTKEHKIYVIDVNKIDDSIPKRLNTVRDTYSEKKKTHRAYQYFIDKSLFDTYTIPNYIIFYEDDKDLETQRKKYYTYTSRALF